MNKSDAARLARRLMAQYGVNHIIFEFDNAKRRLGATHHIGGMPFKITLSAHYVALLPEAEIEQTIRHEIAHALAGPKAGHGPIWRAYARQVGHTGQRCASPSDRPAGKYTETCPDGHAIEIHRLPQRVGACGDASHGRRGFRKELVLTITENKTGRKVPMSRMPAKYQAEFARIFK